MHKCSAEVPLAFLDRQHTGQILVECLENCSGSHTSSVTNTGLFFKGSKRHEALGLQLRCPEPETRLSVNSDSVWLRRRGTSKLTLSDVGVRGTTYKPHFPHTGYRMVHPQIFFRFFRRPSACPGVQGEAAAEAYPGRLSVWFRSEPAWVEVCLDARLTQVRS